MKPFVKLQCEIVDRFGTREEFLLAVSLLCLMDYKGRIPLDQVTLAARLHWDLEKELIPVLGRLMQPDPESRCKKNGGAFVAYIDPKHPEQGFVIPAALSYRKRNADTELRRAYRRSWMKKNRPSRAKRKGEHGVNRGEHGVNRGELETPSKVNRGEHGVNKGEHEVNCDIELRDRFIKEGSNGAKGNITTGADQPSSEDSSNPDLTFNVDEIVGLICEKVYASKLRKNQVGQETVRAISAMLPFSREQIELVGEYYNMPPDDCWPELKKRRALGIDLLVRYWADQVSVAIMFDQKYFA
jgi:hypothetical protein